MAKIHVLGPFRLDAEAEMLLRGTEPVVLGRRAVALLRALVERPGETVSKDELIEAAWPGLVVEEANLTVQIAALRRVLGEETGGEPWIETLPRRGYRYVGPPATEEAGVSARHEAPALPLPDRPSIAVLPFVNLSGDPEQEYFTDGIVEDIITGLSRIRWLFVVARNSSSRPAPVRSPPQPRPADADADGVKKTALHTVRGTQKQGNTGAVERTAAGVGNCPKPEPAEVLELTRI